MINYKGMLLARNSHAYELYMKGDLAALDRHLKQVNENHEALLRKYS